MRVLLISLGTFGEVNPFIRISSHISISLPDEVRSFDYIEFSRKNVVEKKGETYVSPKITNRRRHNNQLFLI